MKDLIKKFENIESEFYDLDEKQDSIHNVKVFIPKRNSLDKF